MNSDVFQDDRLWLDLLRKNCGMQPALGELKWRQRVYGSYSLEALEMSEWFPGFERLMRNRLIMGALRYGRLHAPGKPAYNRVASIVRRALNYERTGNLEHLVDIANEAGLEFTESFNPLAHWETQDDAEHTRRVGQDA